MDLFRTIFVMHGRVGQRRFSMKILGDSGSVEILTDVLLRLFAPMRTEDIVGDPRKEGFRFTGLNLASPGPEHGERVLNKVRDILRLRAPRSEETIQEGRLLLAEVGD